MALGNTDMLQAIGTSMQGHPMTKGSKEPRWHQLTHLKEDVDSHEFEDPNNASNFSDAEHDEINKKRKVMQFQVDMMNKQNIPMWMIRSMISEQQSNLENAG